VAFATVSHGRFRASQALFGQDATVNTWTPSPLSTSRAHTTYITDSISAPGFADGDPKSDGHSLRCVYP